MDPDPTSRVDSDACSGSRAAGSTPPRARGERTNHRWVRRRRYHPPGASDLSQPPADPQHAKPPYRKAMVAWKVDQPHFLRGTNPGGDVFGRRCGWPRGPWRFGGSGSAPCDGPRPRPSTGSAGCNNLGRASTRGRRERTHRTCDTTHTGRGARATTAVPWQTGISRGKRKSTRRVTAADGSRAAVCSRTHKEAPKLSLRAFCSVETRLFTAPGSKLQLSGGLFWSAPRGPF